MSKSFMSSTSFPPAVSIIFSDANTYTNCMEFSSSFDFFKIRMAFSIGQKVDNETLEYWLKNFNVRILEGFIPNNSAIIATINTPIYYKFGSLGCKISTDNVSIDGLEFDEIGFATALSKA